jgi:hypothetical protein
MQQNDDTFIDDDKRENEGRAAAAAATNTTTTLCVSQSLPPSCRSRPSCSSAISCKIIKQHRSTNSTGHIDIIIDIKTIEYHHILMRENKNDDSARSMISS